jgi:YbbR domain-containing protein
VSWHRPITQNLGIKVVAVLLAVALYLHVVTERPVEAVLYFPVEVSGLADTLALTQGLPESVGARLRGTGKQFIWLRIEEPPLRVDLTGVGPGHFQKALTPGDFAPAIEGGLEVLTPVDPIQFSVQIEPRATRPVPVSVRVLGEPASGFLLSGPVRAEPESVSCTGPATWVASQERIETETVEIAGLRAGLERRVALLAPPPWAAVAPGSVLVHVAVEPQERGEAMARPQVVGLREKSFTSQLDPQEVRLHWSAPQSVAETAIAKVRVHVDLELRGRGRYVLPVVVSGPGAEYVVRVEPESVAVTLH